MGGTATVVDYFVFWLFDALLLPSVLPTDWEMVALAVATAIGFCVGLLVNWVLSVRFVFRAVEDESAVRTKKSFALFSLIGVIGLAITEIGVVLLVGCLPEITLFGVSGLFGTAWAKWIAKGVMTCTVLVWNYLGRKLFIFKS